VACGFAGPPFVRSAGALDVPFDKQLGANNDVPAPINEIHMSGVLTLLFFTVGCLRNVVFAEKVVESFGQKVLHGPIGILRLNQAY
jgi:hypothetical protein